MPVTGKAWPAGLREASWRRNSALPVPAGTTTLGLSKGLQEFLQPVNVQTICVSAMHAKPVSMTHSPPSGVVPQGIRDLGVYATSTTL
jgi:hypothetical protein